MEVVPLVAMEGPAEAKPAEEKMEGV